MRRWALSDKVVTPSLGGRFWFVVSSTFWVMAVDWELWFPGPVTGSGAFWPLCYTHPVLSEKLKQLIQCTLVFMRLNILTFCLILFNLSFLTHGDIVLAFYPLLLGTYIWGNVKMKSYVHTRRSHILKNSPLGWCIIILLGVDVCLNTCLCRDKPTFKILSPGYFFIQEMILKKYFSRPD